MNISNYRHIQTKNWKFILRNRNSLNLNSSQKIYKRSNSVIIKIKINTKKREKINKNLPNKITNSQVSYYSK